MTPPITVANAANQTESCVEFVFIISLFWWFKKPISDRRASLSHQQQPFMFDTHLNFFAQNLSYQFSNQHVKCQNCSFIVVPHLTFTSILDRDFDTKMI